MPLPSFDEFVKSQQIGSEEPSAPPALPSFDEFVQKTQLGANSRSGVQTPPVGLPPLPKPTLPQGLQTDNRPEAEKIWEHGEQWDKDFSRQAQPLIPVSKLTEPIRKAHPDSIGVGVLHGAAKLAEGLTTPENAELLVGTALASPAIASLAGVGLSAQMGKQVYDEAPEAAKAYNEGRWGDFAELATQMVGGTAMAAGGVGHGINTLRAGGVRGEVGQTTANEPSVAPIEEKAIVPKVSGEGIPKGAFDEFAKSAEPVESATPAPKSAELPTVPETPSTLSIQLDQLKSGQRRAVMIPEGAEANLPPDTASGGLSTVDIPGSGKFVYDPAKMSPEGIQEAVAANRLPEILGPADGGMGAPDKTELQGEPVAVVGRDEQGNTAQGSLTDEARLPETIQQTEKVTPPGGEVSVESPAVEMANRQAALESPEQSLSRDRNAPDDLEASGELVSPPTESVSAVQPGAFDSFVSRFTNDQSGSAPVSALSGGIDKWAEQDVMPAVQRVGSMWKEAKDGIQKLIAPAGRGTSAKRSALTLRENLADLAQRTDRAHAALKEARDTFSKLPVADRDSFVDAMESGSAQPSPDLQPVADTIREMLDSRLRDVQNLGTGKLDKFVENYFPHQWKDPKKAQQIFLNESRRPLQGSKSFLRKRTIPTTAEGRALGLEPISDNPIDLALMKVREMDKYVMAHRTMQELRGMGLMKFVKNSNVAEAKRQGYAQIDDRIGTVTLPGSHGGVETMGYYMAPEQVATIVNNYLSPGLRGNSIFRAYLGTANVLNQFQLGFSAFHLGFTSYDAAISRFGLATEQLAAGKPLKALKTAASTPLAPLTNAIQGSKLLREWYKPGSEGAEIAQLVDAMKAGGGRANMDSFYASSFSKHMMDAFHQGNYMGAALRAPFALAEQAARPVMEYIVPRQKLGVFADLARLELEKLPENYTREQYRAAMAKAWDSVDNRMGQLVYDNLHWNRAAKDLAMASTRSVGWNVGTIREVIGGLRDTEKAMLQFPHYLAGKATGRKVAAPEYTHRMAYILGLTAVTGSLGLMTQYLLTGQWPQEMKDYFFPKTGDTDEHGRPVRISLPSYAKDIYHYYHDPGKTISNKLHPLLSLAAETWQNQDYYGTQIYNEGDNRFQKGIDIAKHVGTSMVPFAVKGLQKQRENEAPLSRQLAPFIGITPAPSSINASRAEEAAAKFLELNRGSGKERHTAAEYEHTKKVRELTRDARLGKDITDKANAAIDSGLISQRDIGEIQSRAKLSPLAYQATHLKLEQALKVYEVATPQEKEELLPILQRKLYNDMDKPYKMTQQIEKMAEDFGVEPQAAEKRSRPGVSSPGSFRRRGSGTRIPTSRLGDGSGVRMPDIPARFRGGEEKRGR
jgi:hypothetical protein